MLNYTELIEQSKAYKIVRRDTESKRLSHAYLFLSADENYLTQFAECVSKMLLLASGDHDAAREEDRIRKRVHPDIKFFGEDKNIDVQVTSDIVQMAQVAPFEANLKIFVLCGAENMNEAAQNKILKTIEEPPQNTYFLILSTSKGRLLPTILSRTKQIELDEISVQNISKMLISGGVSEQNAGIFASCASGNASFAEKLATDENFLTLFRQTLSAFYEINGSRDVLKFSAYFAAKTVDKDELLDIALIVCRDLQLISLGKPEFIMLKSEISKLKLICATLTTGGINILLEYCLKLKKDLFYNVNSIAISDGLLFKIAEVKVKCKKLLA